MDRFEEWEEWIKNTNFATSTFMGLGKFLIGGNLEKELVKRIKEFFLSCQRGKDMSMKEMLQSPENAEKDANNYHDIFLHVAENSNVGNYRTIVEGLKRGIRTRESAEVLREFFSKMMRYGSSKQLEYARKECSRLV